MAFALLLVVSPFSIHGSDSIDYAEIALKASPYRQWMIGAGHANKHVIPNIPNKKNRVNDHRSTITVNGKKKINRFGYNLKNKTNRKFLQHEKQRYGINLGWTKNASLDTAVRVSNWHIVPQRLSKAPVKYDEYVAIGYSKTSSGKNKKKPFLKYSKRNVGINLEWSEHPHHQWKILGGKPGTPVGTNDWVIIYNTKNQRSLLHFKRTAGGHIGWSD